MRTFVRTSHLFALILVITSIASAQPQVERPQRIRTVSIPISIYTKQELRQGQLEEFLEVERLSVFENGDEQTILSIRSRSDVPLSLAVLIQDDLLSEFNLQLNDIRKFIQGLPRGSRVMVAYLRGGSLDIRQRFTEDLAKAAGSLRLVFGNESSAPRNPYDGLMEALNRFDALPAGRRAVLLISDGIDVSGGPGSSSPSQSRDLQAAILRAQRRNVAVYSIFSRTSTSASVPSIVVLNGLGSLEEIADQTGGRLFSHGTINPINIEPFIRQLNVLVARQFLLSYITTNMKRGYYKVEVKTNNPEIKIEHPKGYYYR